TYRSILDPERIHSIVSLIPDEWLMAAPQEESVAGHRKVYNDFLNQRIASSSIFVKEAQHARKSLI
ncbi:MAG TPA: aminotransferase class I and II, partial [Puia sp.]|nr:aminotransferase class I and II [Puia sp.]